MNYFLVDTNIIISYIKQEDSKLNDYINNVKNKFYYTETVLKEVKEPIPDKFIYINSTITENRINSAFDEIKHIFIPQLTEYQLSKFRNDLTIIIEAGYVCYDITPDNDFTEPYLLTNNLKLYNKFIQHPKNKKQLEDILNRHGFEHLIEVVRPRDILI